MKKGIAFLLFIISAASSSGQKNHPQTKQELISYCGTFMTAFKLEQYTDAFESLKLFSAIESTKLDTLEYLVKQQMAYIVPHYGKMLSFEELSEKDVKASFVKLTYLAKWQKYYLKVFFVLYNNGSYWTVSNFKYTEDIDDLF
jgi:hypothetical protein